jgi:Uma2 family endonuclease
MYVETYTYEDYKRWEGDWELIEGVPLAMAPSPVGIHQIISGKFFKELEEIIEECEDCFVMIEEDYIVDEDTVLKPDVAVVCNEDIYSFIKKTPKLIVEVVSPSTIKRDEKVKFEIYEKEGVEWLFLVYPNILKVKVYKLIDGKYKKVGDFTEGKMRLKIDECEGEINFDKIFKKIKKYIKKRK